ncbi:MAG: hypothetical protein R3A78_01810 [Polyangiales bacterium]
MPFDKKAEARYRPEMTAANRREAVIARFRAAYEAGSPFREDRAQAEELATEARAVVDTVLETLGEGRDDASARGECLAMVTLLGRRSGSLGVTPTAGLSLVRALLSALAEESVVVPAPFVRELESMALEGFLAGREERAEDEHKERLAGAHSVLDVAPGVLGVVLSGEMDAVRIASIVDRLGREMLRRNARACVVDLSGLVGETPDRASEVFNADVAARMLGAKCVFAGVSPAWLEAAREGRVTLEVLRMAPTFEAALAMALDGAGLSIRPKALRWWPFGAKSD